MTAEELHRLRINQSTLTTELSRRHFSSSLQHPAFVGRVTADTSTPTMPSRFFSVHPVTLFGAEGEGRLSSMSINTSVIIYVFMLGPHAPSPNDDVLCHYVNHRWVAERMGNNLSETISIPGCLCTATPGILHVTSTNTTSDGGMFQNCDLVYVQTPPEYSQLPLGNYIFLSDRLFTDTHTGDAFRYYFTCNISLFTLTRLFVMSVFGSVFMESPRYTWLMFAPGNTCTPFLLSNGQIFSGGDPTCVVTIGG
jgi:hypothetical protein